MSALFGTKEIEVLNRRLGDALGWRGYNRPRFCWLYAPDQQWFTYDRDDRTLLKKCWADRPAPDGGMIGAVWVLAEWRRNKVFDHHGFGEGIRVPFVRPYGYEPYIETALAPGRMPSAGLTANYIWALSKMIDESAERRDDSFSQYMGEEAWIGQKNAERDKIANRERAAAEYDRYTGAFGNLEPGKRDGYFAFQKPESGSEENHGFFN